MFKHLIVFSLAIIIYFPLLAQDVIIKKNGEELKVKVSELNEKEIKYKKFENLDGPIYIVNRNEVFLIKYEDGNKTIVNPLDVDTNTTISNIDKLFQIDHFYISAGYGFGSFLNSSNWFADNNYNNQDRTYTGPFYLKFEYGLSHAWGIGINFAYVNYRNQYYYSTFNQTTNAYNTQTGISTYASFSGLLRANLHIGSSSKIDPYFGFGLGYKVVSLKNTDGNYSSSEYGSTFPLGFETTFGIRIKICKNIYGYTEAGFAKSAIQFGITAHFNRK